MGGSNFHAAGQISVNLLLYRTSKGSNILERLSYIRAGGLTQNRGSSSCLKCILGGCGGASRIFFIFYFF